MNEYTWGDAPGSPYFVPCEEGDIELKPNELSDMGLLLALAEQEDVIAGAVEAKKELLAEVRSRKEQLREQHRQGKYKMEREGE